MDKILDSFVSNIPTLIAIFLIWLSLRKYQRQQHTAMNSRLDQLVKSENAKGRQDERDYQEAKIQEKKIETLIKEQQ